MCSSDPIYIYICIFILQTSQDYIYLLPRSTSRQPAKFDEDASLSVYLENTSTLNYRQRGKHIYTRK